jgi:hypothetical protein
LVIGGLGRNPRPSAPVTVWPKLFCVQQNDAVGPGFTWTQPVIFAPAIGAPDSSSTRTTIRPAAGARPLGAADPEPTAPAQPAIAPLATKKASTRKGMTLLLWPMFAVVAMESVARTSHGTRSPDRIPNAPSIGHERKPIDKIFSADD